MCLNKYWTINKKTTSCELSGSSAAVPWSPCEQTAILGHACKCSSLVLFIGGVACTSMVTIRPCDSQMKMIHKLNTALRHKAGVTTFNDTMNRSKQLTMGVCILSCLQTGMTVGKHTQHPSSACERAGKMRSRRPWQSGLAKDTASPLQRPIN